MAWVNNKGDIIIDSVLTDLGRKRLALGDGSFNVRSFALGDDEIDYSTFDATHTSGSQYYGLTLEQTPVFEAHTWGPGALKSPLMTIDDNFLLYLSIMQLYTGGDTGEANEGESAKNTATDSFVVCSNQTTTDGLTTGTTQGIIPDKFWNSNNHITIDQGQDTTAIPKTDALDSTMVESQWILKMDNRLLRLAPPPSATSTRSGAGTGTQQTWGTVGSQGIENNIATYYLPGAWISAIDQQDSPIDGPRGSRAQFRLAPAPNVKESAFLFTKLGTTNTVTIGGYTAGNLNTISTVVSIEGGVTRSRFDIDVTIIQSV